jgi:hypothetical protein
MRNPPPNHDKMARADFKAKRCAGRSHLEKRINSTLESGAALVGGRWAID